MTDKPIDAKSLRNMPKIERDRIMEQAAALAADDYKDGGGLNISDTFLDDALSTEEGCISVGGSSPKEETMTDTVKIRVSFKETVEGVVYVTHALPDGVSRDEFLAGMVSGDRNVIGGAINQKWVELDTYNLELNLDSAKIAEEETP